MKYNSIGEQLIAKAKELDPNYKPDKFNDMSEAIDILLNNSGGDIWLDITPYLSDGENKMSISQEGYDLVYNAFSANSKNTTNKYVGILMNGAKLIFNRLTMSDTSDKEGLNFILNVAIDGVKCYIRASIYNDKSVEYMDEIDSSNKIWYDLDKKSGTITQNQYDEIKALIDNDSLAGITLSQYTDGYYPLLSFSTNGTITFVSYSIALEDEGMGVRNVIVSEAIVILPDLSINYISDVIYTPVLTQNLSSQSIISVKTDGYQENLSIGEGLAIKNGALTSTLSNFKYGTLCLNNIIMGDDPLNIELSFFDYIYDSIINGANLLLGTSLTRDTFPQYIKQNKSINLIISLIDNILTLIRELSMMPYFNITVCHDILGAYYYNCPIKKDGSSISLFLGNQEMILNTSLTFDDTFTVEYKKSWYGD